VAQPLADPRCRILIVGRRLRTRSLEFEDGQLVIAGRRAPLPYPSDLSHFQEVCRPTSEWKPPEDFDAKIRAWMTAQGWTVNSKAPLA
jgi:hypothetical protein